MTNEIPGIRPAALSESTCRMLDEYRGFRHVARNLYTINFDPSRIEMW